MGYLWWLNEAYKYRNSPYVLRLGGYAALARKWYKDMRYGCRKIKVKPYRWLERGARIMTRNDNLSRIQFEAWYKAYLDGYGDGLDCANNPRNDTALYMDAYSDGYSDS